MKAIGIIGSYRKQGYTDTAVSRALQGAASKGAGIEKVYLVERNIEYCTNCRQCSQRPGPEPGACIHQDDMAGLIRQCLAAEVLVLGAPVNFGMVTAVTKTFLERLAPLAYWPWGKPIPRMRKPPGYRRAVLITSSLATERVAKLMGANSMTTLEQMAQAFNAEVIGRLWIGMAALEQDDVLSPKHGQQAQEMGGAAASSTAPTLGRKLKDLVGGALVDAGLDPLTLLERGLEKRKKG